MDDITANIKCHHRDAAIKHFAKDTLPVARRAGASNEVLESLEKGLALAWQRHRYSHDNTSGTSEACRKLHADTVSHDWEKAYREGKTTWNLLPLMLAGPSQGQFLKSFLSSAKAKDVLEVGMFTGYSALSMAEALPADGKVVTIDQDEYLKNFFLSHLQDSPHKDKVEIVLGQALDILTTFADEGRSFDAVYLDTKKKEYDDYFELLFKRQLLKPGGTVLVDNAFKGQSFTHPNSSASRFARYIRSNPSLHVVLVPIRDGIFIIRRQEDVEGKTA